jgi:hypothetical protein
MTPQCPKCGKYFTKRVTDWTNEDPTETASGLYAYRCQLCSELFRARKPAGGPAPAGATAPAAPKEKEESEFTRTDSRQYVRINAEFPVTFTVSKLKHQGKVTEIALGGCSLEADIVLAMGAKMKMEIRVLDAQPPIAIDVALVRSVRPTGFGIQFMEIQPQEKERLGQTLEELLKARFS